MKYKKTIFFFFFAFFLLFSNLNFANSESNEKYVNVLSWWGYLDDPKIKQKVENECHVHLSYDEYYTNEQFLNMYEKYKQNYDIIIFSDLLYKGIGEEINDENSNLWMVSKNYYPYFKKHYLLGRYDHNVVFFTHSLMGFLYNKKILNIGANQDIFDIFKRAGKNYVILVDDPAEIHNLLNLGYRGTRRYRPSYGDDGMVDLTYENIKRVTQNSNVYITNDFNKIYKLNNFAFSFMWSGDALLSIDQSKKQYKFTLHPNLSYICTDLLAQIKKTPEASCVARALTGRKVTSIVENSTYYFTPYFENTVNKHDFNDLYTQTKYMLPNLPWISSMTLRKFNNLAMSWNKVKLSINNEKRH